MRGGVVVFGLMALALGAAQPAEGQRLRDRAPEPRVYLDLNLMGADATGEFSEFVDGGFGGEVGVRVRLGDRTPAFLRADGGFMIYGHERFSVCFPVPIGCRVGADVTTTNSVAFFGVGPEIAGSGAVAPYLFGTVGLAYFSTQSSLDEPDGYDSHFNTRHYDDLVTAARVGGGLRVRLGGPRSVLLDVGAEYHRNGVATYLREGDILDHPDGSITLFPNRSEANFLTLRLGVSIPLGGDDDDDYENNDYHRHRR